MKSMVGYICNDRYIVTKHDMVLGNITIKLLSKYRIIRFFQVFLIKKFKIKQK